MTRFRTRSTAHFGVCSAAWRKNVSDRKYLRGTKATLEFARYFINFLEFSAVFSLFILQKGHTHTQFPVLLFVSKHSALVSEAIEASERFFSFPCFSFFPSSRFFFPPLSSNRILFAPLSFSLFLFLLDEELIAYCGNGSIASRASANIKLNTNVKYEATYDRVEPERQDPRIARKRFATAVSTITKRKIGYTLLPYLSVMRVCIVYVCYECVRTE